MKQRYFLWLSILIVCLSLLLSSVFIQLFTFPQTLHLLPGQKFTLSAYYPLSFYHLSGQHFGTRLNKPLLLSNLTLGHSQKLNFDVQILAFGAIPIRKMHVEINEPPLVVPGGQAIGVLLSSRGVVVVGRTPLTGTDGLQRFPSRDADVREGDIILAINGTSVNRIDEIETILGNLKSPKTLSLTVQRRERVIRIPLTPVECAEQGNKTRYRLGLYIEDPAAGVGTLTFYDPQTRGFAGLGHHISEFAGKKAIPFVTGEIVMANISGIRSGSPGQPGEKIGVFGSDATPVGKIQQNTHFGIYGKLYSNFQCINSKLIPMAYGAQVKTGPAEIYTVLKGAQIETFRVEIIKVFHQDSPHDKGLIIQVTDPVLLRETGGIIQGMSGSPIIQNGRFVGAITHVLVNDPTKGYGVLAEWMITEMQKERRPAKAG